MALADFNKPVPMYTRNASAPERVASSLHGVVFYFPSGDFAVMALPVPVASSHLFFIEIACNEIMHPFVKYDLGGLIFFLSRNYDTSIWKL